MTDARVAAEPRNAASLVLVRRAGGEMRVLMGVRGRRARFMPERRVFPGGVVEPADLAMAERAGTVAASCLRRLRRQAAAELAPAHALTAIRETWEETGLRLGEAVPDAAGGRLAVPGEMRGAASWGRFLAAGLRPAAERLRFICRAITPASYPIRFDARFFLAAADAVAGDPDDLTGASGELRELAWLPLAEVVAYGDLPRITRRVLAEVEAREKDPSASRPVPFFAAGEGGRPGMIA